jgi:hypothetical protein
LNKNSYLLIFSLSFVVPKPTVILPVAHAVSPGNNAFNAWRMAGKFCRVTYLIYNQKYDYYVPVLLSITGNRCSVHIFRVLDFSIWDL